MLSLSKIERERRTLEFLKEIIAKEHCGDDDLVEVSILSVVSMHPAIKKKIHMCILGKKGGGKSHLLETVFLTIVPPEMRFEYLSSSPKGLIYASKNRSFEKTIIILDDVTEESREILKMVASNDRIGPSRMTVVRGKAMGLKMEGQPVIWFSTVTPLDSEEGQLSSRFFYGNVMEDHEHSLAVDQFVRSREVDPSLWAEQEEKEICQKLIRRIVNFDVKGFSLEKVIDEIPIFEDSRLRGFFYSFVKCFALINWRWRERKKELLLPEKEDLVMAKSLFSRTTPLNLLKIDEKSAKILAVIGDEEPMEEDFKDLNLFEEVATERCPATAKEIANEVGLTLRTAYRRLKLLEREGLVESKPIYLPRGRLKVYWRSAWLCRLGGSRAGGVLPLKVDKAKIPRS